VRGLRAERSSAGNLLHALLERQATILQPAQPPLPMGGATVVVLHDAPMGTLEAVWEAEAARAREESPRGRQAVTPASLFARFQLLYPSCGSDGDALAAALEGPACAAAAAQQRAATAAAMRAPPPLKGADAAAVSVLPLLLLALVMMALSMRGGGGVGGAPPPLKGGVGGARARPPPDKAEPTPDAEQSPPDKAEPTPDAEQRPTPQERKGKGRSGSIKRTPPTDPPKTK